MKRDPSSPLAKKPEPVSETAVCDPDALPALLEMAGPEMAEQLLVALQDDLHAASLTLREALDPFDLPMLRKATHVVVSLAATCGAGPLAAEARALSTNLGMGENAAQTEAVTQLRYGITALVEKIAEVAKKRGGRRR